MSARIIQFPVNKKAQTRLDIVALDKEVADIHARVDKEINDTYGSLEGYGRAIMREVLSGRT